MSCRPLARRTRLRIITPASVSSNNAEETGYGEEAAGFNRSLDITATITASYHDELLESIVRRQPPSGLISASHVVIYADIIDHQEEEEAVYTFSSSLAVSMLELHQDPDEDELQSRRKVFHMYAIRYKDA